MSMENIRDLFLEDETFEDARNKFNTVLQRLFRSMIDTESNEGSITLKMDVSMQTEFIPNHDPDADGENLDGDQGTLPDGDNEADNGGYNYEDPEEPEE